MSQHDTLFSEYSSTEGLGLLLETRQKLHAEESPYQRIEVYETTRFGNLLVLDGFVMLTGRDNFIYHEMMTHPALYTHPDPKRVLIIGGGDCGCLREVLKHPGVTHADQVELDERVTRVSEEYFPELCESNSDPRAHLHFVDGIKWVEDAAAGDYDIIIVDSTDPVGQAARLFQAPFYSACRAALSDDAGILIVQSESPLLHRALIKTIREQMQQAGFAQLATLHYPQCTYPSGWWTSTMASNRPFDNARHHDGGSPVMTRYYDSAVHQAALALPVFLRDEITQR